MGRKAVIAVVALIGALLGSVGTASAAPVGVKDLVAQPIKYGTACQAKTAGAVQPSPEAGTHRDYCVAFNLNSSGDDAKKLTVSLPAGVVGDPGATPRCTFDHSGGKPSGPGDCGAGNQVGTVTAAATIMGVLPASLSGEIYNLKPQPGEPARLGIALDQGLVGGIGPTYLETAIRVRVPDAGLDSVTDDIPNSSNGIPIKLNSQSLLLWGPRYDDPSNNSLDRHTTMAKPFMTLPTRCDVDAVTTVKTTSYGGQDASAQDTWRPTQCEKVPWTPDLEVGPTLVPADTPGEAFAKLIVPTADTVPPGSASPGDDARRQSYLKDVDLQLPAGLALNPPVANGLLPCTPEQFGQNEDRPPDCPENTVMGTVEFRTPIFPGDVLTGKVYFGTPKPGIPLVNFISVEDPRLRVKLVGFATIDPVTTAITAHFTDQPQVPFESFKFTYIDPKDANGNSTGRATLTAPVGCGTYPVTAAMSPWNLGAVVAPTKTFEVNQCVGPVFQPSIGAAVTNAQAGADTTLNVHIGRPDKNLRLQTVKVSLPPGLTGRLTAAPQCEVADARANRCGDESLVGSARVTVGTGPAPLPVPGKVYLTKGFDGGIAGLAVVVDTKVPALDLGKVVVMHKLVVRPDTGIDVVSDPLPQSLQGIPTVYRSIDLTMDKPGFMRNATSCDPKIVHGDFGAVGGATAAAETVYQATGCENLPFAPKLTASVGAPKQNSPGGHPPLNVTIEQADGEAAMSKTVVVLPSGIGVDLKNLKVACSPEQFASTSCPEGSRLGTVTADTSLLPDRLSGGAYLMTPERGALPGIGLDLGLTRLLGAVSLTPQGRLQTSFNDVPDVPLRKLVLALNGGPKSVLTTAADLCSGDPSFDAAFTAQSGAALSAKVAPEIVGCDPLKATGKLSGVKKRRPALRFDITSSAPLKEIRFRLPKYLALKSSKMLRKKGSFSLDGKKRRDAVNRSVKGQLRFRVPASTSKKLRVYLPAGVLKLKKVKTKKKYLRPGQKVSFRVYGVDADGKLRSATVRLKAAR